MRWPVEMLSDVSSELLLWLRLILLLSLRSSGLSLLVSLLLFARILLPFVSHNK